MRNPVAVDGAAGRWVVTEPSRSLSGWHHRLIGLDLVIGVPVVLVTAVLMFLAAVNHAALLAMAPLLLGASFFALTWLARRRVAADPPPAAVGSDEFADLPDGVRETGHQLVLSMASLFASRTVVAGWVDEATLATAHQVTWQALRSLRDTADLRAAVREAEGFAELRETADLRRAELAAVEAAAAEIADRMADVARAVAASDAEIAAVEAERARDRRVAELRERLAGQALPADGRGAAPRPSDLDAIAASVTAAAEVLAAGGYRGEEDPAG
ncbi:hypothetical protein V5P93_002763 [Actinokineospora auranticolor]|uniref:Uncharacterized protein n=1 Tax=Actinokineospora auranticolor TaxID=155976 RepID=A0A2S6H094_9PSEU|nr:hypothetical protein [Actinokineospora auranticolor]PPK70904.1 hypothetical protein CLV40_10190 [Actinokineospora auranticolor]